MTAATSKVEAYAQAMLEVARGEGQLADVEDDLFRFARAFEASDELRIALTDPQLPVERRIAVVDELHRAARRCRSASRCSAMIVAAGRANDLPAIVDRFVELAAAEREREVAEVRCAIALDDEQIERLARRARAGHRQDDRGEGRSSTRPCSAGSSPGSATPSSTAPSVTASNR